MDDTAVLAAQLGLSVWELVQAVGGAWHRRIVRVGGEGLRWFGAGDPLEVLLGVGQDRVSVATPDPAWDGVATLALDAGPPRCTIDRSAPDLLRTLAGAAAAATGARRATFSFCAYCRDLVGPEHKHDAEVCMGCAVEYLGVVY